MTVHKLGGGAPTASKLWGQVAPTDPPAPASLVRGPGPSPSDLPSRPAPAGGPAVAGAAGGWALGLQPSAAPASAGWGSGAPGPSRLFFVPFDLTLVFTGAGLPDFVLDFAFLRFFLSSRIQFFSLQFTEFARRFLLICGPP